jgi:hypothetical protein
MKKTLVFLAVTAMTLAAFAGVASGSIYAQYWAVANSEGWLDYGQMGNYHVLGRYNYNDHAVWVDESDLGGGVYVPAHENWHINWDTKCLELDTNKPITITHYNFNYILNWHYKQPGQPQDLKWKGYIHIVDPQASNEPYIAYGIQAFAFLNSGLSPGWDRVKDQRVDAPTLDAQEFMDYIFEAFDLSMIPHIKKIDLVSTNGDFLEIHIGEVPL